MVLCQGSILPDIEACNLDDDCDGHKMKICPPWPAVGECRAGQERYMNGAWSECKTFDSLNQCVMASITL